MLKEKTEVTVTKGKKKFESVISKSQWAIGLATYLIDGKWYSQSEVKPICLHDTGTEISGAEFEVCSGCGEYVENL